MAKLAIPAPEHMQAVASIDCGSLPAPEAIGFPFDGCSLRQPGGRRLGLETLQSFLHVRGKPYRRAMSSPLAGAEACSRLSPHLAWGTVSLREVAQATRQRQLDLRGNASDDARGWRGSLVSFSGRLHWQCHFMQKLEIEPSIEYLELHPAGRGLRHRPAVNTLMEAWALGPFIDACMRSLVATGWINFRMRAMLVPFASYNLWLPWQETGLVLARLFTDYEPGIHWPQIQMQSGTTGINTIRIYNPVKQGHDQDPTGAFVRCWMPELIDVPDAFVQEPWTWEGAAGLIGRRYPVRIVDLTASTAAAKECREAGFQIAAAAIQTKYGSRRSGMSMTSQKRRAKAKASQITTQLKLDL